MQKLIYKKMAVYSVLSWMLVQGAGSQVARAEESECKKSQDEIAELRRMIVELKNEIQKQKSTQKSQKPRVVTRTTFPNARYPHGVTFTKVNRNGFGEAWRDPSGMIWGDVVLSKTGAIWQTEGHEPMKYCRSIGAQLPSREDFARLREYMGAIYDDAGGCSGGYSRRRASGYVPQVLPNLQNDFWTLTDLSSSCSSSKGWVFDGASGKFSGRYRFDDEYRAVRCVTR